MHVYIGWSIGKDFAAGGERGVDAEALPWLEALCNGCMCGVRVCECGVGGWASGCTRVRVYACALHAAERTPKGMYVCVSSKRMCVCQVHARRNARMRECQVARARWGRRQCVCLYVKTSVCARKRERARFRERERECVYVYLCVCKRETKSEQRARTRF